MSEINYQALREAAVAIETVATPQKLLAFRMKVTPQVVLALLDERDALNERIAELEANLAELAEDHQKAIESIKQADSAVKLAHEKFSVLAAENAGLKSNLIYWGGEASEPVRSPLDYAHEAGLESGEEFEMQVAARMPNLTYRVVSSSRFRTEIELVGGLLPETPATDAFLDELRAQGVELFAESQKEYVRKNRRQRIGFHDSRRLLRKRC